VKERLGIADVVFQTEVEDEDGGVVMTVEKIYRLYMLM
jgi:hypothetical protein